ncbi:MAG: methyltransferase domain-containing protein [Gaiellaceae bacterium]
MPPPLPDEDVYLRTHSRRYALLLELVAALAPDTILVVGPSYESVLLREALPDARVDTLGWEDHRFPRVGDERHVQHDLNDPDYPELELHDVVICSEVIEHLHISPVPVLRFLGDGLAANGRLVLQTPNATALPKRLRMLLGRNPYEPIRDEPGNPGHFHEYTVGEVRDAVEAAGLEVERVVTANYFNHGSRKNRAYRALGPVLPGTLREGITVVARGLSSTRSPTI